MPTRPGGALSAASSFLSRSEFMSSGWLERVWILLFFLDPFLSFPSEMAGDVLLPLCVCSADPDVPTELVQVSTPRSRLDPAEGRRQGRPAGSSGRVLTDPST